MKRAVAFICLSVAMFSAASANEETRLTTQKTAHTYIAQFRDGTEFHSAGSVSALIRDGEIDSLSLSALSKELKSGNTDVRESIVRLLGKVALTLDSNDPSKFPLIRDRAIIKTLLTDGFAKEDSARQLAGLILLKKCKPADLAVFDDIYVAAFKAGNSSYLQIAAKAKTTAAKPYVDKLAKHRFWSDDPARRMNGEAVSLWTLAVYERKSGSHVNNFSNTAARLSVRNVRIDSAELGVSGDRKRALHQY